jgi:hypothetical protein
MFNGAMKLKPLLVLRTHGFRPQQDRPRNESVPSKPPKQSSLTPSDNEKFNPSKKKTIGRPWRVMLVAITVVCRIGVRLVQQHVSITQYQQDLNSYRETGAPQATPFLQGGNHANTSSTAEIGTGYLTESQPSNAIHNNGTIASSTGPNSKTEQQQQYSNAKWPIAQEATPSLDCSFARIYCQFAEKCYHQRVSVFQMWRTPSRSSLGPS